jgi:uncharacterized protein YxjI
MFDASTYEVRQRFGLSNRYNVYEDGEQILASKQKRFKLKEEFSFTTTDGQDAFRVKAGSVLDIAGTYDIVDLRTGDRVGAVRREVVSLFRHEYTLLAPDGSAVATLREDSRLLAALRRLVTTLIPFSYDIVGPDGTSLGRVKEGLSLRDRYAIELTGDIDPRLAVVGTVVVDAIEGN